MTIEDENRYMQAQLAELERRVAEMKKPQSAAEANAISAAQARADSVAAMFGTKALPPLQGESARQYRERLVAKFQPHSPKFSGVSLRAIDDRGFAAVEDIIYADAVAAAKRPETHGARTIAIEERDAAGRLITRYYGEQSWLDAFAMQGVTARINRSGSAAA